jgi:uncharacterized protein (TIGR02118 family)
MHKLMLVFKRLGDTLALEERWSQEFVPLAEKMPGLRRIAIARIVERPDGLVDTHMVHELYFDDLESLRRAMVSDEGQAAGQALMSFASGRVTMYLAEHLEDEWPLKYRSAQEPPA